MDKNLKDYFMKFGGSLGGFHTIALDSLVLEVFQLFFKNLF
jgi:hypothetical protein